MSTLYSRTPGKNILAGKLQKELDADTAVGVAVDYIDYTPSTDALDIYMDSALSGAQETAMDACIAAHTDAPVVYAPRISVVDADRTLQPWEMVTGVTGLTAHRTFTLPPAAQVDPLHILSIADEDESCRGNRKMQLVAQGADSISGVTEAKQPGSVLFARSNGVDTWVVRAI